MGDDMTSIGNVLKLIRAHRSISQGEMAERLGVTQNFLSQVEHGKKDVSATKLNEFAKNLGISKEIMIIASCDVPTELQGEDKKIFLDMKKSAMKIILLEHEQYA
jgi:transcriptional regulator with XRE-family HTH domain